MAGQSDPHLSLFSAEEVEFMAEDELVEIVPNMRMDALNLVCGDFGPFMPQIAIQVPLWLAVALKKRGKCTISCPEWMSVEKLTEVLEAERESPRVFQPLPFHYVEISRLLFDHAREDIPDTYMVRSLVEDIRNVRFHKIEINLEEIQGRAHAVKIKNLSAMEVNIVRPFVVRALQAFYKHDSPEMIDQVEPSTIRQPQATDNIPEHMSIACMTHYILMLHRWDVLAISVSHMKCETGCETCKKKFVQPGNCGPCHQRPKRLATHQVTCRQRIEENGTGGSWEPEEEADDMWRVIGQQTDRSDSDSGFSDLAHLAETISYCRHSADQYERNLISVVQSLLLSISVAELKAIPSAACNACCIRFYLVKLLRISGYDAAVCSTKWKGRRKVPGGDHEYIDITHTGRGNSDRFIIDIDFRSHFEIARAVDSYDRILNSLPAVYAGSLVKLEQYLPVMVEAARTSLKQNSMPLPPWRSLAYLQAKWRSPYQRKYTPDEDDLNSASDHSRCCGHLKRLQSLLRSEIEVELTSKHKHRDTRKLKLDWGRHSSFRTF
ncbi:unnamed protein product [Rhodiola kirilowii]